MDNLYLASGGAQLEVNKQRQEEADKIRQAMIQRQQVYNDSRRVGIQEQDLAMRQQEAPLTRLNQQLELRMKQNAFQKEQYETSLLQNMQNGTSAVKGSETQAQDYERLAQTNRQLGMQMNKVDPIKAKKYFDAADSYDTAASNRIKTSLDIKSKQVDQAGQILANIGSQEDLNAALPELFASGLPIPPELRNWNDPKTREWISKQALRSPTIAKDLQDQVGFLKDQDALAYDKQKNEVLDENLYNKSLRERASQISKDIKTTGSSKGSQFVRMRADQIMGATEELARSLQIIGKFPVGTTSGMFGEYGGEKSFTAAPLNTVARFATTDQEAKFQTTASNIGQALAIIEAGGYKPNQAQIDNYNRKFTFGKGTTIGTRLFTMSDAIAQTEARLKITLSNPDVPEAQKRVIEDTMTTLKQQFPLSPEDLLDAERVGVSYQEAFNQKKNGTLDRYLELKKKAKK